LTRPDLYPKPLAHCNWQLAINVAGQEFLRIGDVTGPDKTPGFMLQNVPAAAVNGWNWSHDPRFAWILKNVAGRNDQSDAAWQAIETAAAQVRRAPWLDQPSRQVYNWAGILETGRPHDDWRFRRAAYVRTGLGIGHAHGDSLDLQIVAHGLPMTVDGGQRGGYSKPGDAMTRLHNVVEVNGHGYAGQSWVRTLADATGARYLAVSAEPPIGTRLFRRQVALIDVDEGTGSLPLSVEQQQRNAKLPPGVVTANSYVFDVFRVSAHLLFPRAGQRRVGRQHARPASRHHAARWRRNECRPAVSSIIHRGDKHVVCRHCAGTVQRHLALRPAGAGRRANDGGTQFRSSGAAQLHAAASL